VPCTRRHGGRRGEPIGRKRAEPRDPQVGGEEGGDAGRPGARRAQHEGTEDERGHGPEDRRREPRRIEADTLDRKRSAGDGGLQQKIGGDPQRAAAAVDGRCEQGEPAPALGGRTVQPESERGPAQGDDRSDGQPEVDG